MVAGITGYNFPFLLNLAKVFPALLAGNTLVLKPSPFTPYSALLFGQIAEEVGLPRGVLNIVTGGIEVGSLLSSDPRVDMVSFTGSESVGSSIMSQAAPTLKRVHLELGGKSALIVRADADIQGHRPGCGGRVGGQRWPRVCIADALCGASLRARGVCAVRQGRRQPVEGRRPG